VIFGALPDLSTLILVIIKSGFAEGARVVVEVFAWAVATDELIICVMKKMINNKTARASKMITNVFFMVLSITYSLLFDKDISLKACYLTA
jgi:hypothetical protein